jgi:hypothetical protein
MGTTNKQQDFLGAGIDWVLFWVQRPANAGTVPGTSANTTGALQSGYAFATAIGTDNTLANLTVINSAIMANVKYYTGFSSAGAYGTTSSSSSTTDLNNLIAIQLVGDNVATGIKSDLSSLTNVVVTTGAVTLSCSAATAANPMVLTCTSTTGVQVGMNLWADAANWPAGAGKTNGVVVTSTTASTVVVT